MRFSCRGTSKGSCTTWSGSEQKPRQRRGGLWTPIFSERPRHIEITFPTTPGRSSDRQYSRTLTPSPAADIRHHGHANIGLELARKGYSLGCRRARERAEGAAAAGAKLD